MTPRHEMTAEYHLHPANSQPQTTAGSLLIFYQILDNLSQIVISSIILIRTRDSHL